jgi:hypothetical protein
VLVLGLCSCWLRCPTQDVLDMAKTHPQIVKLPATSRLVEIRGNRLRFPLMPPGPKQFFCDEE